MSQKSPKNKTRIILRAANRSQFSRSLSQALNAIKSRFNFPLKHIINKLSEKSPSLSQTSLQNALIVKLQQRDFPR